MAVKLSFMLEDSSIVIGKLITLFIFVSYSFKCYILYFLWIAVCLLVRRLHLDWFLEAEKIFTASAIKKLYLRVYFYFSRGDWKTLWKVFSSNIVIWGKVFKSELSKFCGRQTNFTFSHINLLHSQLLHPWSNYFLASFWNLYC